MKRIWPLITLLLAVSLFIGCGDKDPTGPGGSGETILSDNAVILDDLAGVSVQSITQNQVVIAFSGTAPSVSSGDILVSSQVVGEHSGCLRKVTGVDVQGNTMTITTTNARLTDAIIQCDESTTFEVSMSGMLHQRGGGSSSTLAARDASERATGFVETVQGVRPTSKGLDLSNVVLYSGDVGGANLTVKILSGSIEFEPGMDVGWSIQNRNLTSFHAIATGEIGFNFDVEAGISGSLTFSEEKTLATYRHIHIMMIGKLPVVIVTDLSFVAGFEAVATASGSVVSGFQHTSTVQVGAEYEGSWSPVWQHSPQFTGRPTTFVSSGDFSVEVYVRPAVSVKLYGIAGPYISAKPYLAFQGGVEASRDRERGIASALFQRSLERISALERSYTYWWELVGGITGTLGFDVSVMGYSLANFNTDLVAWETVIAGDSTSSDDPTPSVLSLAFTGDTDSSRGRASRTVTERFRSLSSTSLPGFRGSERGTCQVTATWTQCPDNDFQSYTLYRSMNPNISQNPGSAVNLGSFTTPGTTSFTDNGVTWETTYYYALRTTNDANLFSWSNEASITTPEEGGGGGGSAYPDSVESTVDMGAEPHGLCVLPSGDYLYVTSRAEAHISVVRTSDFSVVSTINVGATTEGICSLPSGNYVYATSANGVKVIRTSDNTVVASVPVGNDPFGICALPSGNYVYVANRGSGTVSVIETSSNSVVKTITVGYQPKGICSLPSGAYVYVANYNSSTVSVIRTSDNTVVKTLSVGTYPFGICAHPSGSHVYVTNEWTSTVSVIRTSDNTIVATVEGFHAPRGICALPSGDYMYIANFNNDNVSILATATNTVIETVNVGDGPYGIAVSPTGNNVFVTNHWSDDLSVLSGSGGGGGGGSQDGSIVAWGRNVEGQCNVPSPNSGFVAVAAGTHHSLGLKEDGSIVAWGSWVYGVPSPNSGFVAVAGGMDHSLGLKEDGSIVAWGYNYYGQCDVPSPNTGFVAVAGGDDHSLGLKANGSIVAWGYNWAGQCNVPSPNSGFVAVAAGGSFSLGLKANGSIVAWGSNSQGQCNVPSPNEGFVAVSSMFSSCFGLKADGSIVKWGSAWPVPPPNTGFIAVGNQIGLKADGTIVSWGNNAYGECDVPSPNSGFVAVAGGGYHRLGLKE